MGANPVRALYGSENANLALGVWGLQMGIVYVLSNPAFDSYVKVGHTIDLVQRLRSLDNTSVPLPFRCVFAIEVENHVEVERLVHQAFAMHRTRTTREFFEIDARHVIAALKLTGGREVTPKSDIAEDREGIEALEKAESRRRTYSFADACVNVGDVLTYSRDSQYTATVIGPKKIEFEGEATSLSKAALTLLHREGYTWQTVNGWNFWTLEEETIAERLHRLEQERAEQEEGS